MEEMNNLHRDTAMEEMNNNFNRLCETMKSLKSCKEIYFLRKTGDPLAIKVLKEKRWDIVETQFKAEVVTMGRTRHRNLIKLYGFCYDGGTKALVYEYMENGSFDVILSKNLLDLQQLYSIAIGIAKAISYLHEGCNPQIIHFDIKPANVLLDAHFCPKLIDFGLSMLRFENSEFADAGTRGSPGYVAPEITQLEPVIITHKCDVYSFGMILFDILASKRNCAGQRWLPGEVWDKFEENQLDTFIKDCGINKEDEVVMATTLATVALLCAEHDPQNRPSMSVVANMLEVPKMLEVDKQLWKPVDPFPYYDPSTDFSTMRLY